MLKDDLQPTDAFRKMKIMPNKLIKIFFILLSCLIRLDVSIWNRNKNNLFIHEIETNWINYTTQIKLQNTSYSACTLMKIYI